MGKLLDAEIWGRAMEPFGQEVEERLDIERNAAEDEREEDKSSGHLTESEGLEVKVAK